MTFTNKEYKELISIIDSDIEKYLKLFSDFFCPSLHKICNDENYKILNFRVTDIKSVPQWYCIDYSWIKPSDPGNIFGNSVALYTKGESLQLFKGSEPEWQEYVKENIDCFIRHCYIETLVEDHI